MATNVVMPKMGESITEGTILRWLKQPGDQIKKDEPILEISTDKVDTEVPAPSAGTLLQQLVQEKQTVAVGTPIAVIGEAGEKVDAPAATSKTEEPKKEEAPKQETPASQPSTPNPQPPTSGSEQAIVMPKMGESITEGTILRWLKKEGDSVKKDEPILEISTDKVDTEVPAPMAGTITRIVAKEKDVVAVGNPVAYISGSAGAAQQAPAPQQSAPAASQQAQPQPTQSAPTPQYSAPAQPAAPIAARSDSGRFYSPLVRTIAKQEGVSAGELDAIGGSGLGGRVNKNDILNYIANRGKKPAAASASGGTSFKQAAAPSGPAVSFATDMTIPMDNIRQKIAEHMVRSKHTSAHVTSVSEVDMTNIVKYHSQNKDEFQKREGIKLTYTPLFIEAMVRAIQDFPFINSQVDGTNIIVKKDINFGVAVGLPAVEGSPLPPGLIVPVIKKAQYLNVAGIAHAVSDLAAKARNKKLTPDDISGGTFTLTNPGMFGNLFGTPIINQPQVAIMSTGAIVKKPVVKTTDDGEDFIAIRPMMFLGLSYDHRLIDGMYGVQFTERVKYYLENFSGE